MIKVTTSGDSRALLELSKRFRLLGLRRGYLTREVAKTYEQYARERFAAGTDPYGDKYDPLKYRSGLPFVGRSIERDATRAIVDIDSFKIIVKSKWAYVHAKGMIIRPKVKTFLSFVANGKQVFAKRVIIPQRRFIPDSGMPPIAEMRIKKTIKRWMKGILDGK
jgi:phage gpG-like protein